MLNLVLNDLNIKTGGSIYQAEQFLGYVLVASQTDTQEASGNL